MGNIYNDIVFVNSTATVNSDWESASLSSRAIDSESGSSDFALYFKAESRGSAVDLFVRRAGVLDCRANSTSSERLKSKPSGLGVVPPPCHLNVLSSLSLSSTSSPRLHIPVVSLEGRFKIHGFGSQCECPMNRRTPFHASRNT